jgi:hypothetical protein
MIYSSMKCFISYKQFQKGLFPLFISGLRQFETMLLFYKGIIYFTTTPRKEQYGLIREA